MPERTRNAPRRPAGGAPTTITDEAILPDTPLTPAACRAWEATAPLTDPSYWLGRSHGYTAGYADGQADLLRWQEAQFVGHPLPWHADSWLTAEQAHGRQEAAR